MAAASNGGRRGRRKIPMARIGDKRSLLSTFNKRMKTLVTKSEQLSILCGVPVSVSIQSPHQTTAGELIEAAFDGCSSSSSSPNPVVIVTEEGEKGRRKNIERIDNRESLNVTFSKRRSGLLKLAEELSVLCGVHVALSVRSPGGKLVEKTFHGGGDDIDDDDDDDRSQQQQQHRVLETARPCDHQVLSPSPPSPSPSPFEQHQQQLQQLAVVDLDSGNDEFICDYNGFAELDRLSRLLTDETIDLDEIMEYLEDPLEEVGAPHDDDDYDIAAAAASSSSGLRYGWSSDDQLVYVDEITRSWAEGVAFADSCFSSLLDCY